MIAQKGKASKSSCSVNSIQFKSALRGFFIVGRKLINSDRLCNITASSKPIVAARVGEISKGLSVSSDEYMDEDIFRKIS
jgi:hypothetical protein